MRKLISCLCLSLMMVNSSAVENAPGISAAASVVMCESGDIVHEVNGDKRLPIASTTKIMTAIVAIENNSLDDMVEIEAEYCNVEGSSMYLKAGEEYSVLQLLQGLMLVSGNDAALALAHHTAGSVEAFSELMNEKAKEIGMVNTSFKNPHGLNEAEHYSTARDMAKLMLYCMENESFVSLTAQRSCVINDKSFVNHNKLLYNCEGCVGGKTGYTSAAGRCLVSVCQREDTRFICVTLSAPDDWNDHKKLYDWAYSQYSKRLVSEKLFFDIPVVSGDRQTVTLKAEESSLILPRKAKLEIKAYMSPFVFAPVGAGERGGYFEIYCDDKCVAVEELIYASDVEVKK